MVDHTSTAFTKRELLERDIAKRSGRRSLERRGIIKAGGRLASQRSALKRELVKDNVARQMSERPDYSELVESGIAPSHEVAPSLQAAARQLERNLRAHRLNEHLYRRAEADELRGEVMPAAHVAPALRSAHIALERAFTRDHLNNLLSSRPEPDELVQKNILRSRVAPALQQVSQRLQRQMTEDKLNSMLEAREQNAAARPDIVPDARVASTLQSAQRDLQRNLAKSNLYHALQARPTRSELEERGVLYADDDLDYDDNGVIDSQRHAYAQTHSPTGAGGGAAAHSSPFQQRSRNFVLTRLLLKFVANLGEAGEISMQQKGYLKDLIVDQDPAILAAAEVFEADGQIDEFKDSLLRFSSRSG